MTFYSTLVNTHYGQMIVPTFDSAQTPALLSSGKALCHSEIDKLRAWLIGSGPQSVLLDVGANIGSFAFGCRDLCAEVHAFEPQRIIFNMMAGSIALNGWTNVFAYHTAVGKMAGWIEVPQFDYGRHANFGGVEFGASQHEFIGQHRGHDPAKSEVVSLVTLGSFGFDRVDVMKIDVEGMELDVLEGATGMILRTKPRILIEHAKTGADRLRPVLEGLGYKVEPHGTMDFACTPL